MDYKKVIIVIISMTILVVMIRYVNRRVVEYIDRFVGNMVDIAKQRRNKQINESQESKHLDAQIREGITEKQKGQY